MEKKSFKYLQWKLSETEKRLDKEKESSRKDFISQAGAENLLHKKVEAMRAELRAGATREEELKQRLALLENNLLDEKARLHGRDMEMTALDSKHQQLTKEFTDHKDATSRKMAELREHYEKQGKATELRLLTQIDQAEQRARLHLDQAEELKLMLGRKERDYGELKERHKKVVAKISEYLSDQEEERRKLNQSHQQAMRDVLFSHEREKVRHDNKLLALGQEVSRLQELKTLLPLVEQLKATIQEKCQEIRSRDNDMVAMRRSKFLLLERLEAEQERVSAAEAQLTGGMEAVRMMEARVQQAEREREGAVKAMQEAVGYNKLLRERTLLLEAQLRACGAERDGLRERVKQLECYQFRFKDDLQLCMAVINNPIHLRKKIMDLRARYVLNSGKVESAEKPPQPAPAPPPPPPPAKDGERKKKREESRAPSTGAAARQEEAATSSPEPSRRSKHIHTKGQMLC